MGRSVGSLGFPLPLPSFLPSFFWIEAVPSSRLSLLSSGVLYFYAERSWRDGLMEWVHNKIQNCLHFKGDQLKTRAHGGLRWSKERLKIV